MQAEDSEMENEETEKQVKLEIGQTVSGIVTSIQKTGLIINVIDTDEEAFMPLHHLSVWYQLNSDLLKTYSVGEKLENLLCIDNNRNGPIVSLREAIAYRAQNLLMPEYLKENQVVRGSILGSDDRTIRITVPCTTGSYDIQIKASDIPINLENMVFYAQEGIVLNITAVEESVKASCSLNDVFNGGVEESVHLLEQFLLNIQRIHLHLLGTGNPLSKFSLGQRVSGVVEKILSDRSILRLPYGVRGVVTFDHEIGNIKRGQKVQGVVLWINFINEYVNICLDPNIIDSINENQGEITEESFAGPCISEVLLLYPEFVLCTSNYKKQLVFIPIKIHENDFNRCCSRYDYTSKEKLNVLIYTKAAGRLIGIVQEQETEDSQQEQNNNANVPQINKREHKRKNKGGDVKLNKKRKHVNEVEDKEMTIQKEQTDNQQMIQHLRELVSDNYNNSQIWNQYISLLIEIDELEEAKKAVELALSVMEEEYASERIDMWVTCLYIEHRFGTKKSFDITFYEATQNSNLYELYLKTIQMFAKADEFEAMDEKIKIFCDVFQTIPETWCDIAEVYFTLGRFDEARCLKQVAMDTAVEEEKTLQILISFAIMEIRYGDLDEGKTVFESILSANPHMIEVRNTYLNELSKKKKSKTHSIGNV